MNDYDNSKLHYKYRYSLVNSFDGIWKRRKTFSQWEHKHSFSWKLRCYWLEGLGQLQTTLEILDPGAPQMYIFNRET